MSKRLIKFKPSKYIPYPDTKDYDFQKIISVKKEFQYTYDSSEKSCDSTKFMLQPHQEFVKRFISPNTHYNGLLMFHGLGSGKTCSAIGICEETRKNLKYNKNFKKILIIASPNVQKNFQLQLFDENKLKKVKNQWFLEGCLGSSLLDEIGIYTNKETSKKDIIKKIKNIIKKYYSFVGYIEFSNIIEKKVENNSLMEEFKDRLIVIDEIHNIRTNEEDQGEFQKVATNLELLVKKVKHMKLLFLTGTPIFNKPEEIIFILNILNINDRKPKMKKSLIFDKNGVLKEKGEDNLIILSNGYISYVRGENPYIFPHLVSPKYFDKDHSSQIIEYPRFQFNGKPILNKVKYIDLFINSFEVDHFQQICYKNEIKKLEKSTQKFKEIDYISYFKILLPLQSLNVVYPYKETYLLGTKGLDYTMDYEYSSSPRLKHSFTYKNNENMFDLDEIGKYSIKIKTILDHIQKAEGVILIYSQWIDSGLLPMALALESIGYKRACSKTYNLIDNKKGKYSYSIICGDKELSPDNEEEVERLTNNNENGQRVKIVLISQTGTEGIDLKYIRQVHIMEPWYNMNRIEQIIGRARRNCSHKALDKEKRNVQIFLYGTKMSDDDKNETLDMYLYRLAESKSINMGKVTRILKKNAIDCLLNESQQDFSKLDKTENIILSDSSKIDDFEIKDNPFTNICDYQEQCDYICKSNKDKIGEIDNSTYKYDHLHNSFVIDYLRHMFQTKYVYSISEIHNALKTNKNIKEEEIEYGLEYLMKEPLLDQYGEKGYIIKISNLLLFQPYSSDYEYMPLYERQQHLERNKSFEMEEIITLKQMMTIVEFNIRFESKLKEIQENILFHILSPLYDKNKEIININIKEYIFDRFTIEEKLDLLNDLQLNNNELKNLYEPYKYDENTILLIHYEEYELYKLSNKKWIKQSYIEEKIKSYFKKKYKLKDTDSIIGYIGKKGTGHLKKSQLKILNNKKDLFIIFQELELDIDDYEEIRNIYKKNKEVFELFMELILRIMNDKSKNFLNPLEMLVYINKID